MSDRSLHRIYGGVLELLLAAANSDADDEEFDLFLDRVVSAVSVAWAAHARGSRRLLITQRDEAA